MHGVIEIMPVNLKIARKWNKVPNTERGQKRLISVTKKHLCGLMGIFPQRQGRTIDTYPLKWTHFRGYVSFVESK